MSRGEQFVLPFRGDQYSFGLTYTDGSDGPKPNIDLSCVCFDRTGTVLDYVSSRRLSALDGAVISDREKTLLPEEFMAGTPGDEVIHFFPKKLDPACEVLIFVASAQLQPTTANDLSMSPALKFNVQFLETDATEVTLKSADVKALVSGEPHPEGSLSLGNGHQSLIVATCYLDQPGWTVLYDLTSHRYDSFGLLVPKMQEIIHNIWTQMGVALDAARKVAIDQEFKIPVCRAFDDRALSDAASLKLPTPVTLTKLRVDVAWATYPIPVPPEDSEEDPEIEPEVTFQLIFYDINGEEVQQVGTNSREGTGVKVGRDDPEEVEEEEAPEPEPEPEKEEAEEGEEGKEEGGEPKEEELPPAPKPPRETPFDFDVKDVVFITMSELPKEVRSMVLVVSQYAGSGFKFVRYVKTRLVDVSAFEVVGTAVPEAGANVFAEFSLLSKYFDDVAVTQTVLLKMYKEYTQSAFQLFSQNAVTDLSAFVADIDANKKRLKEYLEVTKAAAAADAAAQAKAEEEGEEVTADTRPHVWRYATVGLCLPGESLEDVEHDIKNVVNFDGNLEPGAERTAPNARVQFANMDTYFGGYVNDQKSGTGVYAFASGAMHVGQYKEGKRDGPGLMVFPDASMYEGTFKADKFDGQGQYRYPDGSVYTGSFAKGLKDGPGVYWDTAKGCLRGEWNKGILKGTGTYDQPAYQFQGNFVQGVPCGPGTFTLTSHRTLDMDLHTVEQILSRTTDGPTLSHKVEFSIPEGSGADPVYDEEGELVENDDKPPLPAFPKYEGLGITSDFDIPVKTPDITFPPVEGLPVPLPSVPSFAVATGIVAAAPA